DAACEGVLGALLEGEVDGEDEVAAGNGRLLGEGVDDAAVGGGAHEGAPGDASEVTLEGELEAGLAETGVEGVALGGAGRGVLGREGCDVAEDVSEQRAAAVLADRPR